jgi:hypothetical protein
MPVDTNTHRQIANITDLENKLMQDLNNYNKIYTCYLYSSSNTNINLQLMKKPSACSVDYTNIDVDNAKALVDEDIRRLKSFLVNYNGTNQALYMKRYDELLRNYDKVVNIRNDLDTKLAELYGTDNGISNYYKNMYASTMLTKVLITILITSLAYYTFMQLIKK